MTNEDRILSILETMQAELETMQADIAGMKSDITELKEVQAEHTTALNALLEWADECREADRFPLPKLM